MKRAISLMFLVFCFSLVSIAQNEEEGTFDTLHFYVAKNERQLNFKEFKVGGIDNFHQYRVFGKKHLAVARSGNLGLAAYHLNYKDADESINNMFAAYSPYLRTEDSLKYYNVDRPLTTLTYVNGAKTEQFFQLFHTQNLGEGLNVSFNFERISSEGFYVRQLTNHTRFHVNYNLHSRNKKFHSKGYYLINNLKSQENGGVFIKEDKRELENTILIDINLFDAHNRFRGQEIGTNNQYVLFQKDSADLISIEHKIYYKRSFRNYLHDLSNSNTNFYTHSYFDTTYTKDSTFADDFGNYLGLSFFNYSLNIGARHDVYHYAQNNLIEKTFNSTFLEASYASNLFGQQVDFVFEKGMSGYHKEEQDFSATITTEELGSFQFELKSRSSKKQTDYFLNHFRSNQYFRNNDFKTINTSKVGLGIKENKSGIYLSFSGRGIVNYVYLDSLAEAQQHQKEINIWSAELNKKFSFFKGRLNLFNRLAFQKISKEELIPLPSFISYHSLYYKNNFFEKKLHLEFGFDFYYIGKFQGYAYSPAAGQFHLRKGNQSLGNIQQLDVFLNMEVKENAVFFVKFENLLYDNFSTSTYRIENYPIPGRALKIGLKARLLN